jgi:hypothetical protein
MLSNNGPNNPNNGPNNSNNDPNNGSLSNNAPLANNANSFDRDDPWPPPLLHGR